MSRWLFALVLALVASAIWVGAAFADASTYHSNYTATTRACAGCHRAHTGQGSNLIKTTSTYGLCTSCHGTTNGLDVVDGTEWQTDSTTHAQILPLNPLEALKGGGFEKTYMNTGLAATKPAALTASTSAHKVNGMSGYTGDTVWGLGAISGTANPGLANFTLECSTCHDPHGKSGPNNEPTYRLLRSDLSAKVTGASPSAYVPEDGYTTHFYGVDSATWVYYGQSYNAPIPPVGTTPYPDGTNVNLVAVSQWCAGCHTRVHATAMGSGSTNSGDAIFTYRHRTNGTSADNNYGTSVKDGGGTPACLTCHVSHGSSAAMTRQAAQVPVPGGVEGTGPYQDSALLRVNERGVCELCHNK